MNKKIFITGTSGIGKTTLANFISKKYQIPFVNGSSTVLWEKYGIQNHSQLLLMGIRDPQKGLDFQYELVEKRLELTKDLDSFVTDRSVIDNAVYFLYQNAPYLTGGQTESYLTFCAVAMRELTCQNPNDLKMIYLSRDFFEFDEMPAIDDDGKRIINTHYQNMMDNIFQMVLDKNLVRILHKKNFTEDSFKFIKVKDYNWEMRISIVQNFLETNPTWFDKLFM